MPAPERQRLEMKQRAYRPDYTTPFRSWDDITQRLSVYEVLSYDTVKEPQWDEKVEKVASKFTRSRDKVHIYLNNKVQDFCKPGLCKEEDLYARLTKYKDEYRTWMREREVIQQELDRKKAEEEVSASASVSAVLSNPLIGDVGFTDSLIDPNELFATPESEIDFADIDSLLPLLPTTPHSNVSASSSTSSSTYMANNVNVGTGGNSFVGFHHNGSSSGNNNNNSNVLLGGSGNTGGSSSGFNGTDENSPAKLFNVDDFFD